MIDAAADAAADHLTNPDPRATRSRGRDTGAGPPVERAAAPDSPAGEGPAPPPRQRGHSQTKTSALRPTLDYSPATGLSVKM